MIGARAATGYGEHIAAEVGYCLAAAGRTIVSGLSYDIDAAAHRGALAAEGVTLTTLIDGIAGGTLRARVWRGMVEANAADRTLAEHEAIYTALAEGDANLAKAAALVHISTTERWLRRVHGAGETTGNPDDDGDALSSVGS